MCNHSQKVKSFCQLSLPARDGFSDTEHCIKLHFYSERITEGSSVIDNISLIYFVVVVVVYLIFCIL